MITDLVSIILPAYNVEKYISQCVDSILCQTYENIEIIIVDDDSTDSTGDIVVSKYHDNPRIKYIYQQNKGSGPARNNGIEHAKGEFIIFVDPDDWVDEDFVKTLMDEYKTNKPDLVCCGYTDVIFEDGMEKKRILRIPDLCRLNDVQEVRTAYARLLQSEVLAPPTRKLYLSAIINKYDIRFPALRRSQDIPFNYHYYNYVKKCSVLNTSRYYYRIEGLNNYIGKLKPEYYKTIEILYTEVKELFESWGLSNDESCYDILNNYFFNLVLLNAESNSLRNIDLHDIFANKTVKEIVRKAMPNRILEKVSKSLILGGKYGVLKKMLSHRHCLRKIKRLIGR